MPAEAGPRPARRRGTETKHDQGAEDHPREGEARHLKELVSAHVAGMVIVPTRSPKRETHGLLKTIPHVQLLRRIAATPSTWFGIDDNDCLRTGTRHLLELGHRRIAYRGGTTDLSTGEDRLKGFRRAFTEACKKRTDAIEVLGPPTLKFGLQAIAELMAGKSRPSAVITGSVQATQAVLETSRTARLIGSAGKQGRKCGSGGFFILPAWPRSSALAS